MAIGLALALTVGGPLARGPPSAGADASGAPTGGASGGWTVYHGNSLGTGESTALASVDTTKPAWTSPALDGQIYGQPVFSGANVYVATEADTVYALSSSTGTIAWSSHLASPVPSSDLPCGDISPRVGITATPVVDPSRQELFVVADELIRGSIRHELAGLSTSTGKVMMTAAVDPPGSDPAALLQRTGLALDAGSVVFGLGGNYGDCASYRGRVVSAPEVGGPASYFTVDSGSGQREGAVWMGGGAPAVDPAGHIWVSVGNGSVESPSQGYDHSDSVLELSSSLQLLSYFAPSDWAQNNASDLDLSTVPAVLGDGQVVVAGKDRVAYLLNGADLGGIGGQEARVAVPCGDDIDGGPAVEGDTIYLPCLTGPVAVLAGTSPDRLEIKWRSDLGGGPPVLAAGLVWTIGRNGTLYGLDPGNGALRQQAAVGAPANHFPTPGVGSSLLVAASADRLVAFRATPAATPASGTPTSSTAARSNSTAPALTAPASTAPASTASTRGHASSSTASAGHASRTTERSQTASASVGAGGHHLRTAVLAGLGVLVLAGGVVGWGSVRRRRSRA